ncbi:hypothetical protein WMY93_009441 [Mugilogobius chulae]|uniref:Uncharacterized protein n=1 Tax=Mugilogobius chulae TaxID=88201 RepID=A0AAW0PHZ3_9GOBI
MLRARTLPSFIPPRVCFESLTLKDKRRLSQTGVLEHAHWRTTAATEEVLQSLAPPAQHPADTTPSNPSALLTVVPRVSHQDTKTSRAAATNTAAGAHDRPSFCGEGPPPTPPPLIARASFLFLVLCFFSAPTTAMSTAANQVKSVPIPTRVLTLKDWSQLPDCYSQTPGEHSSPPRLEVPIPGVTIPATHPLGKLQELKEEDEEEKEIADDSQFEMDI